MNLRYPVKGIPVFCREKGAASGGTILFLSNKNGSEPQIKKDARIPFRFPEKFRNNKRGYTIHPNDASSTGPLTIRRVHQNLEVKKEGKANL